MAIRTVRKDDDLILRKKSKVVKEINDKILSLLDDMKETMVEYDGVGLAAVQVGILRRIFVADMGGEVLDFINPEILEKSGSQVNLEGCLSIPGETGYVERPNYVKVRAMDRNGEYFELELEEYFATVICHEYDHLDGILYTDKTVDPPENQDNEK